MTLESIKAVIRRRIAGLDRQAHLAACEAATAGPDDMLAAAARRKAINAAKVELEDLLFELDPSES